MTAHGQTNYGEAMRSELFAYTDSPMTIDPDVAESHRLVWGQLQLAGTWWSADELLAIAGRARAVFAVRHLPPWSRNLPSAVEGLDTVLPIVDHLTTNPGSIDKEWAMASIDALGDGHYVELVAVVATTVMIDMFAACAGVEVEALPPVTPDPGQPSRQRPEGLADIGAHVPMVDPFPYANVARALSLVPSANRLFRTASVPMYSAPGMSDLVWDTPLSRPQVELVASRVAALNECFY